MQRRLFLTGGTAAPLALLGGCGFHLRGPLQFPFRSIAVQGAANSTLLNQLKRALAAQTQLVEEDQAHTADVLLQLHSDRQEQANVVLGTSGTVREVQLRQYVDFSLVTPAGKTLIDHAGFRLVRDVSYTESEATAKQYEFESLYRDMRNDAVQQVLRRLAALQAI